MQEETKKTITLTVEMEADMEAAVRYALSRVRGIVSVSE